MFCRNCYAAPIAALCLALFLCVAYCQVFFGYPFNLFPDRPYGPSFDNGMQPPAVLAAQQPEQSDFLTATQAEPSGVDFLGAQHQTPSVDFLGALPALRSSDHVGTHAGCVPGTNCRLRLKMRFEIEERAQWV